MDMAMFCTNVLPRNGSSITVVGAGKSGQALAFLGKELGFSVFVTEQSPLKPETQKLFSSRGISWEETHSSRALEGDAIVLSSGIPPTSKVVKMAQENHGCLLGELDFVSPHIKGDILGITGSNGKSTTVALLAYLLQRVLGEDKVSAGGNIGIPLGEVALKEYACVVAELSSFQLYWAETPCLSGAAITNIVPDHLDWHGGYEAYVEAKRKIVRLLRTDVSNAPFVYRSQDASYIPEDLFSSHIKRFPFSWRSKKESPLQAQGIFASPEEVFLRKEEGDFFLFDPHRDLSLMGRHNVENAAFAVSLGLLWQKALGSTSLRRELKDFAALPHRCENRGTLHGVTFVNDSKGTNVAATVTALESLQGEIIVLLGGKGKGEDYEELARTVSQNAREAILFGAEAALLERELRGRCQNLSVVHDLEEAFRRALDLCRENDTILLSPACTSWDVYTSYAERGEHFRSLVQRTFYDIVAKRLRLSP
jgi:UDP-N-acetylmuramoylalanine--D-glutamate ligase